MKTENVIKTYSLEDDQIIDNTIRPETISEYIGQSEVKENIKIFVEAGALVSAPCCGPCLGGHTGIIGPDEVSLSTSNRNFKGRQGSPDGKVFLSSAAVAAASAIAGKIVAPE